MIIWSVPNQLALIWVSFLPMVAPDSPEQPRHLFGNIDIVCRLTFLHEFYVCCQSACTDTTYMYIIYKRPPTLSASSLLDTLCHLTSYINISTHHHYAASHQHVDIPLHTNYNIEYIDISKTDIKNRYIHISTYRHIDISTHR